jgi:hypothetical protein
MRTVCFPSFISSIWHVVSKSRIRATRSTACLGFRSREESANVNIITPDYTLSAREVFIQVTRDFLNRQRNLDALALVLHTPSNALKSSRTIEGLPSWVLDFFSPETAFPFSNVHVGHQYTVGLSRVVDVLPCVVSGTLQIKGITMDVVQVVEPSCITSTCTSSDQTSTYWSSGPQMLESLRPS